MTDNSFRKSILGDSAWTVARFIAVVTVAIMMIVGLLMATTVVIGGGKIDVKAAFFQGSLQTGSTGLLFAFIGLAVVIVCVLSKATSVLTITRGEFKITHKGQFTKTKAEAIGKLLKSIAGDPSDVASPNKPTGGVVQ